MRGVIEALVDDGAMLEVSERWARNMVTALARIDGRLVGVIANQPWFLGGVIDATAAQKAARFVRTCNCSGCAGRARRHPRLPARHQAGGARRDPPRRQAAARVRRGGGAEGHVVLRKAYGAYICMNSKDLGADLSLAWPTPRSGLMGPKQAVGVVHRRALAEADDPEAERDRLAAEYADEHVTAAVAASQGFVDELVELRDTRRGWRARWQACRTPVRSATTGEHPP